jgi:hypothetical protein
MMVWRNRRCGEVVVVSGTIETEEQVIYEEEGAVTDFIEYFCPKSMYPPPPVIPISGNLSTKCRNDLLAAFSLLWVDTAACANRQRVMVEHLLDQLGIPRKVDGKPPGLNSRIEKLSEEHPRYGGILDALKEVGNAGSHEGAVRFDDVVQCFKFIEHVVTALVDKPHEEVERAAEEVRSRYKRHKVDQRLKPSVDGPTSHVIPAGLETPTSGVVE